MKLTYRPDGQDEQSWEFQLGRLRTAETEAIEKRTGMAYDTEFREALLKGNIRARRALLWTFLRRNHLNLRFEDVDFAADEVVIEMDLGEWQGIRDVVEKNKALPDEDRYAALAVIDQNIADLRARDDTAEEPGKAPEPSDDTATP